MRVLTRMMAIAAGCLITLTLGILPAAEGAPTHVVDEGDGAFTGSLQTDQDRERERPGRDRKTDGDKQSTEDPEEDTPQTDCVVGLDGEPRICPVGPAENLPIAFNIEQYARQLAVRLQLPTPTPQFGPDPSVNEWNMAAVGYPLWLWTDGPRRVTSTESAFGLTFTLEATYRSTTFELGDGHTRHCTDTTPYRNSVKPGTPSPTCGYIYRNPAPGDGSYTVTATTHCDVDWSVAGFSGTLPGTHTASSSLPVGELQAIVVK